MFEEHNITPGQFNVIIAPITQMRSRRSDSNNGYYIIDGLWGTCFYRIATKRDRFEIVANSNPKCPHTYTKIPATLADNTFFVYVNFKQGYKVALPPGSYVVGMHEAQPHNIGGWWSQSLLVYSPGEPPIVQESDTKILPTEICVSKREKDSLLTVQKIMRGFDIRYISIDIENGYPSGTRPNQNYTAVN